MSTGSRQPQLAIARSMTRGEPPPVLNSKRWLSGTPWRRIGAWKEALAGSTMIFGGWSSSESTRSDGASTHPLWAAAGAPESVKTVTKRADENRKERAVCFVRSMW